MKKITVILSLSIICFSFKSLNNSFNFVSTSLNSEGKMIGVDGVGNQFIICPGSGVACKATYNVNGEIHTFTGSKGKGRSDIEISL